MIPLVMARAVSTWARHETGRGEEAGKEELTFSFNRASLTGLLGRATEGERVVSGMIGNDYMELISIQLIRSMDILHNVPEDMVDQQSDRTVMAGWLAVFETLTLALLPGWESYQERLEALANSR